MIELFRKMQKIRHCNGAVPYFWVQNCGFIKIERETL